MYRIKFPSGEVATIESPEALTEAVLDGSVTSYCFILHERSGQWLPIVRHPHYHKALTARTGGEPAPAAAADQSDMPPILPEPLDVSVSEQAAPPARATAPRPAAPQVRSTPAALDFPDLDDLLEMTTDSAAATRSGPEVEAKPGATAAETPASAAPVPGGQARRGRSRELEFLYVPEVKTGAPAESRPAPRTAGPPPRPNQAAAPSPAAVPPAASVSSAPPAPAASSAPPAPAASVSPPAPKASPAAPTVIAVATESPVASAPVVPAPAPAPAATREPLATAPVAPTVMPPAAVTVAEPEPELAEELDEAPVATLAPPKTRRVERYEYDLVDPVEAALGFDGGPAPIELSEPEPRRSFGGFRRLFVAAGLVVVMGGGLLVWSPWSGGARDVAAATVAAPSADAPAIPASGTGYYESGPAEEEPVPNIYDVPADSPLAARTSFGGTAAQSGAAVSEIPAPPSANVLPRAPKSLRVAVPVVGEKDDRDSVRLAEIKRAIIE